MHKEPGCDKQEEIRKQIADNIVEIFPPGSKSEKPNAEEDAVQAGLQTKAALLWMLGMGRQIDPDEMEWK